MTHSALVTEYVRASMRSGVLDSPVVSSGTAVATRSAVGSGPLPRTSAPVSSSRTLYHIKTTLHAFALEGPYSLVGTDQVWFCDNIDCTHTTHGTYAKYTIPCWRSTQEGTGFVLCDGCVRKYNAAVGTPTPSVAAKKKSSSAGSGHVAEVSGGIVKSGWMIKKGGVVKSWKKRFFVLKATMKLHYFESDDMRSQKGVIDLDSLKMLKKEGEQVLELMCSDRTWHLVCKDAAARDRWARAISTLTGAMVVKKKAS